LACQQLVGDIIKDGLKTGSRITFWLAAISSLVGFPYCFFVFLGAHRADIPSVTDETMRQVLPIPGAIIALSILSLVLGRHLTDKGQARARGWCLAMILMSLLLILLLFTESPY
jgi:hypothetical protein